jgi:uncharacterized protein YfaS (alpha-2-macroglobulin family)
MKKIPWLKLLLFLFAAIALFLAGRYFLSFPADEKPIAVNPAFAEFVASYSGGMLGSGSSVRIVFTREIADSAEVGQNLSANFFSFNPSMRGSMRWLDRRTIEFIPRDRWPSGKPVQARFQLGRVLPVPDELSVFTWKFRIIPQHLEVAVENVVPYVNTELTRLKIEGYVQTADYAEGQLIEQALQAEQGNTKLKVSWFHTSDGLLHSYTVEDVVRSDQRSRVTIKVDGKPVGVNKIWEDEVEIPALSDFSIADIKVEQGPQQHVVIRFSDPLNERQNLFGLIRLTDAGTLDYQIERNLIRVYPSARQSGTATLTVEKGIRSATNKQLHEPFMYNVFFEDVKPAVRFTGKGNILSASEGILLPFEAVSLRAVEVQVIKIFEENVLQFFQVNNWDGSQELRRVGRPVVHRIIPLDESGTANTGKWNRYALDLSNLINPEPGAIYQVRIGFRRSHATYYCRDQGTTPEPKYLFQEKSWDEDNEYSYWDSYSLYGYPDDYDWYQRNNPCNSSYYTVDKVIQKNILVSDFGIIAKRGDDGLTTVFVSSLNTAKPLSGVTVELYSYQKNQLGSGVTGSDGKVVIPTSSAPFALVARNGAQRGYLKLTDGESLSVSNFDVQGEQVQQGIKGFLYGDRGVWRPGDSLYLTFVLEDRLQKIPPAHPVIMELQNPQGLIAQRLVRTRSENGFYLFATSTASSAPTGNWIARVKVGATEFTYPIKIETIKPNRLKILFSFDTDRITNLSKNLQGTLSVNWLHGAPGRNLRAQYEVTFVPSSLSFPRYPNFTFDDPALEFTSETYPVLDAYTDAAGKISLSWSPELPAYSPALLHAVFRGKVFEESGNFSIDRFSMPVYPYASYVGLRIPEGDKMRNMLLTDTTHRIDIVTVDDRGNPVERDRIQITLYKLNWSWWWDNTENSAVYRSFSEAQELSSALISTRNGRGSWSFKIKYPDWGRYLIRVQDPVSGHSASRVVYIDWPGWAGRARPGADASTMLTFATDKPSYNIGEKAVVMIPGSASGRALVSLENGSRILQTHWVETRAGDTPFQFNITADMAPTVYVNVTLIQPHSQTANDLPMRLYGVIPVQVEDPATHLEPVIEMPEVLEPGQDFVIKVSEKNKRTMTYTLAVVDEGLLDITRFKTPDLWKHFYAREALGVKTWDVYDAVIGSSGARMERLLAIGGDADLNEPGEDPLANRFRPVVIFAGPFTLKGGKKEHRLRMPNYLGSVRTMVIAGYKGAYGSAEKTIPVRKPLMVLATLPRVLSPEDQLSLPVTLFAMDDNVRDIRVEVKTRGPLQVSRPVHQVNITGRDVTVDFDLTVKSMTGAATVEVVATAGSYTARDVVEVSVRSPNLPVSQVVEGVVEAGKEWSSTLAFPGMPGTNRAVLEVATIPTLNLGQRLTYLIQYPYGCLEQTISSGFPQLYLDAVREVTEADRKAVQQHIRAAIQRIKTFQQRDGGFSQWPGGEDADSWTTSYAGHFLLEAEKQGYLIPAELLSRWRNFQRNRAKAWRKNEEAYGSELIQAYRLYTLALAGSAELGAMNRLREQCTHISANWMLGAAYAVAGQPEAARKLLSQQPSEIKPYQELAWTYGSDLRDKAILLETLILLNERTRAFELAREISEALGNANYYMNTQTLAWCLKSVTRFASGEKSNGLKFTYAYKGTTREVLTRLPLAEIQLPEEMKDNSLQLVNTGTSTLFFRLITTGTPERGEEKDDMRNLRLDVAYFDLQGRALDISRLEQGQQFVASVTVTNLKPRSDLKNLALSQVFPSGWEITNLRLDDLVSRAGGDVPRYADIRDDRVYTHFDLGSSQQKTFRILLTAAYAGTYYLPPVICEAMYDHTIYARKRGQGTQVVKVMNP